MSQVFDFRGLNEFAKSLLANATVSNPKETRKFLNKQGYALRRKTRQKAKELVGKRTGDYEKSWRKGKVYAYKGDKTALAVRVYSVDPGAKSIENGRRYKKKDGTEHFAEGKHVLEKASKEFESDYAAALDDFMDELVNSI